ncbi:MAG TPA: AMP-binding protein, partial [Solirubrobacteraceae bacterium]
HTLVTLTRAGIVQPERPDHLWHTARALLRFGTTPAAGYTAASHNYPDEPAVVDELGTLSFREVHERTNALAHALRAEGLEAGDNVAVMCRNHRGWIDAVVACSKLGVNALFLNTAFSGPQLADVAKREKPKAVVYDHEFAEVLHDASRRRKRYIAWHEPEDGKVEDALLDDLGTLTCAQVHDRTNRMGHALSDRGVGEGDNVAVMCRNHRGFIEVTVALSKLGANALYLNTSFAGPQITEVVKRENATAIVYDEEFGELIEEAGYRRKRFVGWFDGEGGKPDDPLLEDLVDEGDPADPVPPAEHGKTTILTSGTTGTPKGASRSGPENLDPVAALLSRIPLKARENTHIAAPLFHTWGFAHWSLGMALSSTIVLTRRFDPETTLSLTAQHEATALVVVPVMLQRILELPKETIERYDLSKLRAIPASGSALPGELAEKVMDALGDKLYNLYGSTEVAWATIATPEDLRAAPGTAGLPPRGTVVRIYDEDGQELPPGETGRIFVGNEMLFEGYTGGGSKDVIDGLMASGDVGHFDDEGRLFVDGRDDDMIVSGGENVFPQEVEDLIAAQDGVKEVAVIGVADEEWGQRLKAFVVRSGKKPTEQDIKDLVKRKLARYKVPREVEFLSELPRNATGKILKRELVDSD